LRPAWPVRQRRNRVLGQVQGDLEVLGPAHRSVAATSAGYRQSLDCGRDDPVAPDPGQTVAGGEQAGVALAVAAEQYVRAHAGERHLGRRRPGNRADEVGVDGGGVADRLIQHVHQGRLAVHSRRRDVVQLGWTLPLF
jgi:hypothetical protein